MFKVLKKKLRDTPLWIKISHSDFYQKIRNPAAYQSFKDELIFYRNLFGEKKMKLIFDVGANVGNKTHIFSKTARQVVSFEPSQKCLHILRSRFSNKKVMIIDTALSNTGGALDYYQVNTNEAYSSFSKKHIDSTVTKRKVAGADEIVMKKIPTNTLDSFINTYGVPDYIKIDVEGFEWEVISGLTQTVPLISFEANLPDFLFETVSIIEYLSKLSNRSYLYNINVNGPFLFDSFVSKEAIINHLRNIDLTYLEVYAKIF